MTNLGRLIGSSIFGTATGAVISFLFSFLGMLSISVPITLLPLVILVSIGVGIASWHLRWPDKIVAWLDK